MHSCGLVTAGLGLFEGFGESAVDGLEVFDLQFVVDDLFVAHGIDRSVHVGYVVVVEAAQHVEYGVCLTDVGQEFVAESFSFAGTLDQSGNVYDLYCGRNNGPGVA